MKTISEIQDDMHKLTYELKRQEKKYAQLLKKFRDLKKEASQLKARNVQLVDALRESQDWNWISAAEDVEDGIEMPVEMQKLVEILNCCPAESQAEHDAQVIRRSMDELTIQLESEFDPFHPIVERVVQIANQLRQKVQESS